MWVDRKCALRFRFPSLHKSDTTTVDGIFSLLLAPSGTNSPHPAVEHREWNYISAITREEAGAAGGY